MIKSCLVFILIFSFSGLLAQTDFSKWVNSIYDGAESTALSIFDTNPERILSAWKNEKITWWWVAHVNPSFSADGKRLYFIRAVEGQDKFEAVYINLENTGIK